MHYQNDNRPPVNVRIGTRLAEELGFQFNLKLDHGSEADIRLACEALACLPDCDGQAKGSRAMTIPGHLIALFRGTALDTIAYEGEWPPAFYRSTQRFIDRLEGLIPARRAPHPLKAEAEREVRQAFEEAVNEARIAFGLRQTWMPRLAMSWAERRTRSNGGYDRVRIAMHEYVPRAGTRVDFIEYPSIAADPEIGTAETVPWKAALGMVVAHEVAHSAAFACRRQGLRIVVRQGDSAWLKPHGGLWRHLYRHLRRHLTGERMAA